VPEFEKTGDGLTPSISPECVEGSFVKDIVKTDDSDQQPTVMCKEDPEENILYEAGNEESEKD